MSGCVPPVFVKDDKDEVDKDDVLALALSTCVIG